MAISINWVLACSYISLGKFFNDKIAGPLAMYMLIQENFIALCIFNKGELQFGKYIDMENSFENDELVLDVALDDEVLKIYYLKNISQVNISKEDHSLHKK